MKKADLQGLLFCGVYLKIGRQILFTETSEKQLKAIVKQKHPLSRLSYGTIKAGQTPFEGEKTS